MRRILIISLMLILMSTGNFRAYAVAAYPLPVRIIQPDGSTCHPHPR